MTTKSKAEAPELTADQVSKAHLIELVISNKATAQQKQELAKLLDTEAQEESKSEFAGKIEKVKQLMSQEGISLQDLIDEMKTPLQPMFLYVDKAGNKHEVTTPPRGKPAPWILEMKANVTKDNALEFALTESGKAWIAKVYK